MIKLKSEPSNSFVKEEFETQFSNYKKISLSKDKLDEDSEKKELEVFNLLIYGLIFILKLSFY